MGLGTSSGPDRLESLARMVESGDDGLVAVARGTRDARKMGRLLDDAELAAALRERAAELRRHDYSAGVGKRGTRRTSKPKTRKRAAS